MFLGISSKTSNIIGLHFFCGTAYCRPLAKARQLSARLNIFNILNNFTDDFFQQMDFIESRKRTTEFLSRVAFLRRGAFATDADSIRGVSHALGTSKAQRIISSSLYVWTFRPAASDFSLFVAFGADGRVSTSTCDNRIIDDTKIT